MQKKNTNTNLNFMEFYQQGMENLAKTNKAMGEVFSMFQQNSFNNGNQNANNFAMNNASMFDQLNNLNQFMQKLNKITSTYETHLTTLKDTQKSIEECVKNMHNLNMKHAKGPKDIQKPHEHMMDYCTELNNIIKELYNQIIFQNSGIINNSKTNS